MEKLKPLLGFLVGKDIKTTLLGYLGALAVASYAYFNDLEGGVWYLIASVFAALGRWASQEKAKAETKPDLKTVK